MQQGHFYFLSDSYFEDFNDINIQQNHEIINGQLHDKPCYCAFPSKIDGIYWLIPISSKVEKYHKICEAKLAKYHTCNTIKFGNVLGFEKAFLIQNMIPATDKYIKNEYLTNSGQPVQIDGVLYNELSKCAHKIIEKLQHGVNLIFPDVKSIENKLKEQLKNTSIQQ